MAAWPVLSAGNTYKSWWGVRAVVVANSMKWTLATRVRRRPCTYGARDLGQSMKSLVAEERSASQIRPKREGSFVSSFSLGHP